MANTVEVFNQWLPSVATSGVLGLAIFLLRNRLTKGVQHEYNQKLENLKAELARNKSDLEAIRGGALNYIGDNQKLLFARQLEAIDSLWECVLKLAPAKNASYTLSLLPYDELAVSAEQDSTVRDYIKQICLTDFNSIPKKGFALTNRTFVSELAWAYYSAYEAILYHAVFRMETLKRGLNFTDMPMSDHSDVVKLLKLALPDLSEHIEQRKVMCFHSLLDEIENRLLDEFRNMLSGKEMDVESMTRSAEITKKSAEIMKEFTSSKK